MDTVDVRTGRPLGDHGTYQQAVDYALDVDRSGEGLVFLRSWRDGDLAEWPEYYTWLSEQV